MAGIANEEVAEGREIGERAGRLGVGGWAVDD